MGSVPDPLLPTKLVSQLLQEDAGLRDIVDEFVQGLATRLAEIEAAHEKLDWELLATLAHRLKGASGSYGYPDISRLCAEMEAAFRAHQAEDFQARLRHLAALTKAACAGLQDA